MTGKISKDIGLVLNWRPEYFDLNTAYEMIQNKKKYAWGAGGVTLKPTDEKLPSGKILGILKAQGQANILYGVTVDVSEEFHCYLKAPNSKPMQLKDEHKKYRPEWLKDIKTKASLFLVDIFLLNTQIEANKIIKMNGKPFSSGDRSTVFIDMKKSGLDPNKIITGSKEFDSFSDNPFVQILDYKEDDLTSAFRFLLKNNEDIAKEFFKLCGINKKPVNFEIYLREKIPKSKKTNIPDLTFEWEDNGYEIFVEAKLDSPVNENQLKRYASKGKVICITRSGKEVRKDIKGVTYRSWEDMYGIMEKISNSNRSQKMLMVKYFLGYLTYLGISVK